MILSAPSGRFFSLCSSFIEHMSDKIYASFNTLTITGRVYHAEVVNGQYGEFLAVTLMTELQDDGESVCVQFNNTNGLLALAKKGWLNNGRRVTVTGHLRSFTELYFDKEVGKTKRLKNARLVLDKAVVFDGGLGPAKKAETEVPAGDIEIDDTPDLPAKQPVAVTSGGSNVIDF